jgi:diacylglycerol kinase (ATP)
MSEATDWAGKHVVVVANPATRRQIDRVLEAIRRQAPRCAELAVFLTEHERPVGDLIGAALAEAAVVVACGGDGTVADVVGALGRHEVPIGIVPAGSTNIVARENRIPMDPDAAARLIFGKHRIVGVDVGTCGGRRFLHMAGAGLDGRLFAATNLALKRRVGWPAYVPAAIRNLLVSPSYVSIAANGLALELRSPLVLVANGAGILRPWLPIYPGLRRDDGLLDVFVFTPANPFQIGRTMLRFLSRGLPRSPYVLHLRAGHVELQADPPIPVELDGDVVGSTPARFGVLPRAARLIVPID